MGGESGKIVASLKGQLQDDLTTELLLGGREGWEEGGEEGERVSH